MHLPVRACHFLSNDISPPPDVLYRSWWGTVCSGKKCEIRFDLRMYSLIFGKMDFFFRCAAVS